MMNRMMKAEAIIGAQALVGVCAALHAMDAKFGGHLNQEYQSS